MSMQDYTAETAQEYFDLSSNANSFVSMMQSTREQELNVWNTAIEYVITVLDKHRLEHAKVENFGKAQVVQDIKDQLLESKVS